MITQLLQLCACAKDRAFAFHSLKLLHPLHEILDGLLIHRRADRIGPLAGGAARQAPGRFIWQLVGVLET